MLNKIRSKAVVYVFGLMVLSLLLAACQSTEESLGLLNESASIENNAVVADIFSGQDESASQETEFFDQARVIEAWGANLSAQGEAYLRNRAMEAWAANLTAQGEAYLAQQQEMAHSVLPDFRILIEYGQSAQSVSMSSDVLIEQLEISSDMSVPNGGSVSGSYVINPGVLSDSLTIYQVFSEGEGWLVFHADDHGKPGEILAYYHLSDGLNILVSMESLSDLAEPIHAMLHVDQRIIGRFEYPYGPDMPVRVEGQILNEPVSLIFD
jgi:hypothetical protein